MCDRVVLPIALALTILIVPQVESNQVWPADPQFFCDIRSTPYQWHEDVMVCGDWDEPGFPCPRGDIYLTLDDGHVYTVGEPLRDDHWDDRTTVTGCGGGGAFYEIIVAAHPLSPGRYDLVMDENQDGIFSGGSYPDYVFGNGGSWALEVSDPATECVLPPAGACRSPKPKAYIVAGFSFIEGIVFPHAYWLQVYTAYYHLIDQGWDAEILDILDVPSFSATCQRLQGDPCARGLYFIGEGRTDGALMFFDLGHLRLEFKQPSDVAQCLSGVELSLLSLSTCYAQQGAWETAFAGFPDIEIRTSARPFPDGTVGAWREYGDQLFRRHYTPLHVCGSDPRPTQSMSTLPLWINQRALQDTIECASFMICDSTGCGEDLYPTLGCRDSLDLPEGQVFMIGDEQAEFAVSFHLPAAYTDTISASATLFSRVPDGLVAPELVPLGRHLLFTEIGRDSVIPVDSVQVTMWYQDSEIAPAGIGDEASLEVYWISTGPDSAQFLPTGLDTTLNRVQFTSPTWGLAGIYGTPSLTGISIPQDSNRTARVKFHDPTPNPFNAFTVISYTLTVSMQVRVSVFDVTGRVVTRLVEGHQSAGDHHVTWDAEARASGTYFVRLDAGEFQATRKVTLMR